MTNLETLINAKVLLLSFGLARCNYVIFVFKQPRRGEARGEARNPFALEKKQPVRGWRAGGVLVEFNASGSINERSRGFCRDAI